MTGDLSDPKEADEAAREVAEHIESGEGGEGEAARESVTTEREVEHEDGSTETTKVEQERESAEAADGDE